MAGFVPRVVVPAFATASVVAGLFALLAPALAWAALVIGIVTMADNEDPMEVVGTLTVLGAPALAVVAAPVGALAAVVAAPLAHHHGRSATPAIWGLALNLLAPLTWLVMWGGLIVGLPYLLRAL